MLNRLTLGHELGHAVKTPIQNKFRSISWKSTINWAAVAAFFALTGLFIYLFPYSVAVYASFSFALTVYSMYVIVTGLYKPIPDKNAFVMDHSRTNPDEDFANTFLYYIMLGDNFREMAKSNEVLKNKYEFMKDNVFNGNEYTSDSERNPVLIEKEVVESNVQPVKGFSLSKTKFFLALSLISVVNSIAGLKVYGQKLQKGNEISVALQNALSDSTGLQKDLTLEQALAMLDETVRTAWEKNEALQRAVKNLDKEQKMVLANMLFKLSIGRSVDKQAKFVSLINPEAVSAVSAGDAATTFFLANLYELVSADFPQSSRLHDDNGLPLLPLGVDFWNKLTPSLTLNAKTVLMGICKSRNAAALASSLSKFGLTREQVRVLEKALRYINSFDPNNGFSNYRLALGTFMAFDAAGQKAYADALPYIFGSQVKNSLALELVMGSGIRESRTLQMLMSRVDGLQDTSPATIARIKGFQTTLILIKQLCSNKTIPAGQIDQLYQSFLQKADLANPMQWVKDNLIPVIAAQFSRWNISRPGQFKGVDDMAWYLIRAMQSGITYKDMGYAAGVKQPESKYLSERHYSTTDAQLEKMLYIIRDKAGMPIGDGQMTPDKFSDFLLALDNADVLKFFSRDILEKFNPSIFHDHSFVDKKGKLCAFDNGYFEGKKKPRTLGILTARYSELGHYAASELSQMNVEPSLAQGEVRGQPNSEFYDRLMMVIGMRNLPSLTFPQAQQYMQGVYQLGFENIRDRMEGPGRERFINQLQLMMSPERWQQWEQVKIKFEKGVANHETTTDLPGYGLSYSEIFYLGLLALDDKTYESPQKSSVTALKERYNLSPQELAGAVGVSMLSKEGVNELVAPSSKMWWSYESGDEVHVLAERMTIDFMILDEQPRGRFDTAGVHGQDHAGTLYQEPLQ